MKVRVLSIRRLSAYEAETIISSEIENLENRKDAEIKDIKYYDGLAFIHYVAH